MPKATENDSFLDIDVSIDLDEGLFNNREAASQIRAGKSPRPIVTWNNRRRMAWTCIVTFIIVSVYLIIFADLDRVAVVENVFYYFMIGCGTVVASYMGFTSITGAFINRGK